MKTIDTYIKEAFITKDNIKQISQSANDKQFIFIPAYPVKQLIFSDIKEFESYDELFKYFNTEGEGLKWTPAVFKYFRNDGARIILMTTTEHGVGKRMIKGLPAEYEDDFKSCYKLNLSIRYHKNGHKGHTLEDFFVGYVNCSIDEMGYYKKK